MNVVAASLVGGFDAATGLLGMSHWVDYAFAVVLMLWAGSAFTLSMQQKGGEDANVTVRSSASIVAKVNADPSLFLKFFVAGMPAFILCVVVAFSSFTQPF
ncbi:hypothetical protein [Enterovibrio coralii]|nr:hypothetical protein [Enterovibrio coralii]